MQPYRYKDLVVAEKAQLDERLQKLSQFISTIEFLHLQDEERSLLILQEAAMLQYSSILRERIAAFPA